MSEVIDLSGEWDENDFLQEEERSFLDVSEADQSEEETKYTLEYNSFFNSILAGVTLSHNLTKKINLLIEESSKASFSESDKLEKEIIVLTKKMLNSDKSINKLIMGAYEFFEREYTFWHNSSLKVYKHYFPVLKRMYKETYPESTEIDFLQSEYLYFQSEDITRLHPTHNTIAIYDRLKLIDYISKLDINNLEFFNIIRRNKLEFIAEEINILGYSIEISKKGKAKFIKRNEYEIEESELSISNLPSFNLEQRFEIFKQLGLEKVITSLDTTKKNKNMLLALMMGASIDNAKKLLDGTYKKTSDKEKNKARSTEITGEIKDFFDKHKIRIKE